MAWETSDGERFDSLGEAQTHQGFSNGDMAGGFAGMVNSSYEKRKAEARAEEDRQDAYNAAKNEAEIAAMRLATQAREQYESGNFAKAMELYLEAADIEIDFFSAAFHKLYFSTNCFEWKEEAGDIAYKKMGNAAKAIAIYKDIPDPSASAKAGYIYFKQGDNTNALEMYDKAEEFACAYRCALYMATGEYQKAANDRFTAIERDKKFKPHGDKETGRYRMISGLDQAKDFVGEEQLNQYFEEIRLYVAEHGIKPEKIRIKKRKKEKEELNGFLSFVIALAMCVGILMCADIFDLMGVLKKVISDSAIRGMSYVGIVLAGFIVSYIAVRKKLKVLIIVLSAIAVLGYGVTFIKPMFVEGGTTNAPTATAKDSKKLTAEQALDNLIGEYKGTYGAGQGETGLTLTVFKENSNYRATFEFYNLPGKNNVDAGKYLMNVTYSRSSQKYTLRGYEWIQQPGGYSFANLEGKLDGNVFSGPTFDFKVTRTK